MEGAKPDGSVLAIASRAMSGELPPARLGFRRNRFSLLLDAEFCDSVKTRYSHCSCPCSSEPALTGYPLADKALYQFAYIFLPSERRSVKPNIVS